MKLLRVLGSMKATDGEGGKRIILQTLCPCHSLVFAVLRRERAKSKAARSQPDTQIDKFARPVAKHDLSVCVVEEFRKRSPCFDTLG